MISETRQPETYVHGSGIRELARLIKIHGQGKRCKRKGYTTVRLSEGSIREAEIHWYKATGIGKREFKIKRYTDTGS